MLKLLILVFFTAGLNADSVNWETLGIDIKANWGPEGRTDDETIRPYKIKFDEKMTADLIYRLKNHKELTPPLEGQNYNYGMNTDDLKNWIDYWADNYNFTEREEFLNTESQYITDIQGVPIHFIESYPKGDTTGKDVIPVLLMHGWPGSVREFYSTLPYMTSVSDDRDFALQVIAPSLPGFGFSGIADHSGMGAVEIAVMMRNLMHRLGHEKFFIAGGDWGSIIGYLLCTLFPSEVIGYISNMGLALTEESFGLLATASTNPSMLVSTCEEDRIFPMSEYLSYLTQESGYFHIQATKPFTVGVGLTDSPIGLLAWLLQHIASGTTRNSVNEPDGGLSVYSKEELLDNAMFYWAESKITHASLIYANTANLKNWNDGIAALPTTPPTYVIQAKYELFYMPKKALETKYTNLVNIKVLNDSGHFLAMEKPEMYAKLCFEGIEEIIKYRDINDM